MHWTLTSLRLVIRDIASRIEAGNMFTCNVGQGLYYLLFKLTVYADVLETHDNNNNKEVKPMFYKFSSIHKCERGEISTTTAS